MLVFYEAQAKGIDAGAVADAQIVPLDEITELLVRGVTANRDALDERIAANAKGWTLARMPTIDLAVLRIGAFELFHRPDVPVAVVLDEAVELAKRFSTDDSGRFVNGVLATLARQARPAGQGTAAAGPAASGG